MNAMILTADADLMAGLAIVTGFSLFAIIFCLLMVLLVLIAKWKIFSKAGEKGWKSLIPVYSTYVEYGFTWNHKQGILFMVAVLVFRVMTGLFDSDSIMYALAAIPGIYAAVLSVIQMHKLSKSFGHDASFTVGLLLMNPIFLLILGFGKSQYVGNALKAE